MEGINNPERHTRTRPIIELNNNALAGPIHSDTAPTTSDPIGPAPIARVTTPSALPLNSGRETRRTMADCIVPKPLVPIPSINNSGSDTKYQLDIEKTIRAIKDRIDP